MKMMKVDKNLLKKIIFKSKTTKPLKARGFVYQIIQV